MDRIKFPAPWISQPGMMEPPEPFSVSQPSSHPLNPVITVITAAFSGVVTR